MASNSGNPDQYPVYLGTWTNWSRGKVLGLTLTLRREEANLLVAFTAFFIAFVATRFWRVLCFAFHRLYSTTTSQNAVYHQRQAILRNSSTPEGGIQQLASLIWANRDRPSDWFAPLLVATVALLSVTIFTAAGGLSSQISTAVGTEVLIWSLNCGILDPSDPGFYALSSSAAEMTDNAANYAQQCYSNTTAGNLDCGRFVTKRLPRTIHNNATCPFEEKLCRSTSTNLRIDSGYISSHEHLGINSPDRFFVREVLHCAPMMTEGYTSQLSTPIGNLTLYHYGSILSPSGWLDYLFAAKSIESQYAFNLSPDFPAIGSRYGVSPLLSQVRNHTTRLSSFVFMPIRSVFREDADIVLVFLSGEGVLHSAPSTDEWYRVSSTPVNVSVGNPDAAIDATPLYLPLEPASPLGCANQYQFCHKDIHNCGLLASFSDAVSSAAQLFNTPVAYNGSNDTSADLFSYFVSGFMGYQSTTIEGLLAQLGSTSLASKSSLTSAIQGPLPSNQWQLDVTRWWDIRIASLQAAYLSISYFNPPDPSLLRYRTNFTSKGLKKLCNSQKIKSTNYTSFSVFGLLFTYIAGLLIVLVSYLVEPISQILYKKWGYRKLAHLEWNTNTSLQLQRLAHEQLGFGTWSKGTAEIPVTKAGDLLGCLDISNPDHPVLHRPSPDRILKEEHPSITETPEIETSATPVLDGQTLNGVSCHGDSSTSDVTENATRSPSIRETVSFTVERGTGDTEAQQSDSAETENIFQVVSQLEGEAISAR
ncbi:hypothetical protein F4803DRAFT_510322 [Xylaria telfairii]|nr:hypothetical protein F4803DRAFT_510322 [Xylaria telfairii]